MTTTTSEKAASAPSIRTAEELIAALFHPDPATRLTVLQAVAGSPEMALAFGTHENRDALDALLRRAELTRGSGEWLSVVGAIGAFDDARAVAFYRRLLAESDEPRLIWVAAERLTREPIESLRDDLIPLALQNASVARARAAADLLKDAPDLPGAALVRLALLNENDHTTTPPLDDETGAFWMAEMDGVFRGETRACLEDLEEQEKAAFAWLAERWPELSEENQTWLPDWGARQFPAQTGPLVMQALESGSDRLARTALNALGALGEDAVRLAPALARFATHPDPALRRAALGAGASGMDLRETLARDSNPGVRGACIQRLAREEGTPVAPLLVHFLDDADWSVRAAATDALIGLGAPVVETVRPLVHHARSSVRAAAVQILLALDQETWLARELLSSPA